MRVLHLLDDSSPQATGATLALLHESLGRLGHTEDRVLLLGGSALRRSAQAVGIHDAALVGLPCGQLALGWPGIRRALDAWALPRDVAPASGSEARGWSWGLRSPRGFDLVHCWSIGAFSLAAIAWRRTPRVLTLTVPPSPRAVKWLRTLTRDEATPCALLPISSTIRRTLLSGGVAEGLVHVLRPGLTMSRVDGSARAALRERWGVESESTKVVMLLGDPPQAADAVAAMMAVGLAEESYSGAADADSRTEIRLLLHPGQHRRPNAQTTCRFLGRRHRLIQDAAIDRPWEVLPGCDAALAISDQDVANGIGLAPAAGSMPGGGSAEGGVGGGLSLLWAMAANIPIVGEASYAISEIVEDHHSALLTRPGQPKALAHRLRQLFDDKLLAHKLRDTARHEAFSYFSRQRHCQSLEAVYRQVLERRPVDVPPLEATGGLRFMGRA
ncbi:MAG: glycosyltransferase [Planctomycetota bacterium]|nr:glycosyltransferase [Planctomycetota bacterium]